MGSGACGGVADSRRGPVGMMSLTEDEEMYERAKELRDQVHRDGVRQGLEEGRIDCDSGAELFARVRA